MLRTVFYLQPRRPAVAWACLIGSQRYRGRTVLIDVQCEPVSTRWFVCPCGALLGVPASEMGFAHRCPGCESLLHRTKLTDSACNTVRKSHGRESDAGNAWVDSYGS